MKKIVSFYWSGLLPTVVLIIIIALVGLLITMIVGPVEAFLKTFIPNQYIFPGSGAIFVLLIIPLILSLLTRGKIKKYLGKLIKKFRF